MGEESWVRRSILSRLPCLIHTCAYCCGVLNLLGRYRWIDYQRVDPDTEASHIAQTVAVHKSVSTRRDCTVAPLHCS
jgi:hypothetical protein